jgi:predicted anti-sigma-YlaC factor YlaD
VSGPASSLPAGMPACGRRFDEELLSGYLDRALSQGERQLVELHLEGCAACRSLLDGLGAVRQAARGTAFEAPTDEQWSELPRTTGSRLLRLGGWGLLLAWLTAMTALAIIELARSGMPTWERLAVGGAIIGFLLLLLSVLLDRLHDLRTDRYQRVQR